MKHRADEIDRVIQKAISVMEDSKVQVFEIAESARRELDALQRELEIVLQETNDTIDKVDKLEREYKLARIRLSEVSRNFVCYSEHDIKSAYEKATLIQLDLMVYQEKENYLRARRNDIQKRVKNLEMSVERAETIGLQMNVVLDYLSGDLNQVTRILESAKNRQLIGMKIILAQEDERKRIAREIHDGPAQSLANMILRTEIAERMLDTRDLEMIRGELIDLKKQVRLGLEEIRKVIFNLRPMALDDLGLVPTLRKFVQDFEERTKIHAVFDIFGKEKRLPSPMEAALFRLAQEAFNNALKHAQASHISLELRFQENSLQMKIEDNGSGFPVHQVESKAREHSQFGLVGMRERVELLQGKIEIESAVGQGTKIHIQIPINKEQGREPDPYGESNSGS